MHSFSIWSSSWILLETNNALVCKYKSNMAAVRMTANYPCGTSNGRLSWLWGTGRDSHLHGRCVIRYPAFPLFKTLTSAIPTVIYRKPKEQLMHFLKTSVGVSIFQVMVAWGRSWTLFSSGYHLNILYWILSSSFDIADAVFWESSTHDFVRCLIELCKSFLEGLGSQESLRFSSIRHCGTALVTISVLCCR